MSARKNLLRAVLVSGFLCPFPTSLMAADVFNLPAGQTSLQMTSVGDAGNPGRYGPESGKVDYDYRISKFETTISQYTAFLNAVAVTDTYGLYHSEMATDLNVAGIARSGSPGSYLYSPIGSPNRPVAYVGWGDAARFANWLTNGQPVGLQGPGTTETGSYSLNGRQDYSLYTDIRREPTARYVIPTENEWYKAAYYDPTKGGTNYWFYQMRTDSVPYSAFPPGGASPNPAYTGNFFNNDSLSNGYNDGYAVTGSSIYSTDQNYLTDVGAFNSASSHYGTFDQGGNIMEWNENLNGTSLRGTNGGSWKSNVGAFPTLLWHDADRPENAFDYLGFRIAEVPEPAAGTLLALSVVLLRRPKRLALLA